MFNISGKVIFITGAGQGIGKAIALRFSEEGVKVVIADINNFTCHAVADEINASGGEAIAIQLDVSDLESFTLAIKEGFEHFGSVDILVNNAGIVRDKLILRMTEEDWDIVQKVNLKGCFNGIKAVIPLMMKKRFGRIINITSVVALSGNPGQANYVASKAGIIGLTKSVAKELASRNITVNAVAPGYIGTDITAELSDKIKENLIQQIPLKKIGSPEDIAGAVLFLASEDASYITGQTISVNGGLYM
ncbi:MAG: 3-oxoacyl-[acyl-carrier-protein] reductase [Candidatus Marinimicrobia bacterium]|nr:3-oxoacyl-[acyl-carrier-protein] reductase [Candidatus Neomarinimicrobiota bacterium]MBL7046918.1 3-oxoacyl-[acyl-carrier-protein] reductase [Candidatus Neomarinimicrobiota bacterium]